MTETSKPTKLSDSEKLEASKKLKDEAKEHFKEKDIRGAIRKYHKSLLYSRGIGQNMAASLAAAMCGDVHKNDSIPEDLRKEIDALTSSCYNNLAACLLKTENPDYKRIISHCDHALAIEPENTKAMYRKGCCLFHIEEFDKSIGILTEALKTDPKNTAIKKKIEQCEEALKSRTKK